MLIRFNKVIIEGFQSIGYAEIDLSNRGYTLVNGVNKCIDDNAQSNGAGKSSIVNSICFGLVGETPNGVSKNLVNINTDTGLLVELDFEVDSTPYKIIRTKDHNKYGTSVKLFVNGVDKSGKGIRDTEALIKEYFPDLTSELIGSVIIIGQGMPQRFTGNTPSGRKEVLEKLSKSDFMIDDIKNRLSSRKIKLSSDIKKYDLEIQNIQGKKFVYEKQLTASEDKLNSLVEPSYDEIQDVENKVSVIRNNITIVNNELTDYRTQLVELTQKQSDISAEQSKETDVIKSKYSDKINNATSDKFGLQATIKSLKDEIYRLDSIKDVCPTCGQKLPDVHKVDTSSKKAELSELETKLSVVVSSISELTSNQQNEISDIEQKYKEEKLQLIISVNECKQKINGKNSELELLKKEELHLVQKLAELNATIKTFKKQKEDLENQIISAKNDIEKLSSELLYNNMERDGLNKRLDVVNKMTTIATRDFRGFLLTNIIDYLNNRAKMYCKDIFDTDKIDLCLDGNNLNVTYNGKMYENLSGGEQKKIDIINQLSIRDMLCHFSNFSSNILVLDETFESLDFIGCQKIIDVITKRLTDIESVFIITHRSNLSLPADSTITVIKDESGISHVE